jgi:putative ABC transport system permease protein
VPLGPTLTQDSAATERRSVWPSDYTVFIPATLVRAAGVEPIGAQVIATGGPDVQQAVAEAAGPDLRVAPFPMWDYDNAMRVRTAVTTLSALAIGVSLLGLALNAADRAFEHRRAVARHIVIGMPAHALRIAQLLQVLAPLVIAIALATALGALLARAIVVLGGLSTVARGVQLGLVATATLIAAIVTAAATVPIIRTRLTPDLLRRE